MLVALPKALIALLIATPQSIGYASAAPPHITTRMAQAVLTTLKGVCLPALRGVALADAARSAGFNATGGGWALSVGRERIELHKLNAARNICKAVLYYRLGGGPVIEETIDNWAKTRTPPLALVGGNNSTKRHNRIAFRWVNHSEKGMETVVLEEQRKPQADVSVR